MYRIDTSRLMISVITITLGSQAPGCVHDRSHSCMVDFGTAIVFLQKDLEKPEAVKFLLDKGARVVTTTAATAEMDRLKRDSYKRCRDDRCQVELGQAVSASHMASRAIGQAVYLWDLKSEAIVCTFDLEVKPLIEEPKNVEGFSRYEIKPPETRITELSKPYIPNTTTDEASDSILTKQLGYGLFIGGMVPIVAGIYLGNTGSDMGEYNDEATTSLATGIILGGAMVVAGLVCMLFGD